VAPQQVSWATRAARADLYGDAINEGLVINPGREVVAGLTFADRHGVDGLVETGSAAVAGLSTFLRQAQTGYVRSYALSLLGGALVVVVALMAVNFR
jgi:NADH-quinone oxidoreductase subunit L